MVPVYEKITGKKNTMDAITKEYMKMMRLKKGLMATSKEK